MTVIIHRGQDQIGGSIIEVLTDAAGGSIPRPQAFADVRVFLTASSQKQHDLLLRWPTPGSAGQVSPEKNF